MKKPNLPSIGHSRLTALALLLLFQIGFRADAQVSMNLLGQLNYTQDCSDIWGYTDALGNEYAIMGVFDGTAIIDISDPTNPTELAFISGPPSTWRDMKVWGDHAYITNENSGGLLIIDMGNLPTSVDTIGYTGGAALGLSSAHNIFIDENGYAYVVGANVGTGGALILDLNVDPEAPIHVGTYDQRYVHDCFVRGDTLWTAEIGDGIFSVIDVSDKTMPTILATQGTTSDFTHNCWLSDDGAYLFTTDEVSNANIDAYDVSDLSDIELIDTYQSNPGSGVIPHNTFVRGDFVVTSYYRDGVTIADASNPSNVIETAFYDSSPMSGDGFNGCWGVYPYFPSGNLVISDIEGGLMVIGPSYTYACYLEGVVTDSITSAPVNGAEISLVGSPEADALSSIVGEYATGIANAGTYDIVVSKPGYITKTITGISLSNGVTVTQDIELKPLESYTVTGMVVDSLSGLGLDNANVLITDGTINFMANTDVAGNYTIPGVFEGTYDIFAGRWGHVTKQRTAVTFATGSTTATVELAKGYYDDYIFDFNWDATQTASTGHWEKGEPIGTTFGPSFSNPEFDLAGDFGDECYVTGNDGGGAGTDDIDDGYVQLKSPRFDLTAYADPRVSLVRWFFNDGGGSAPNDSLVIEITDGTTTAVMDIFTDGDTWEGNWHPEDYKVSDFITPGTDMQVILRASDSDPGHLSEAAVDLFRVYDAGGSAPVAAFTFQDDSVCTGETIVFDDNSTGSPLAWSWTFGGGDPAASIDAAPSVTYSTPGTYDVTLSVWNADGSDVTTVTSAVTVFPNISISTSTTPAGSAGGDGTATVTISGGTAPFTVQWNDPYSQTTEIATDLNGGIYTVTVTDANGCMMTEEVTVSGGVNGLEEISSLIEAEILPNPFSGEATLAYQFLDPSIAIELNIFNDLGQLMISKQLSSAENSVSFGSELPAGVYLLQLSGAGNSGSTQLIKIK